MNAVAMNAAQRARAMEIQAVAGRLARDFTAGDLDTYDDNCNRIIGLMQELRQDLLEVVPAPVPLAALMQAGRLPVMYAGESPSD